MISSFARKWLGLPRCLSNIGLYRKGILAEEYKCTKVRMEMTLKESCDPCVAPVALTLATRRKWTPSAATHQAKSALKHWDVVGHMQ